MLYTIDTFQESYRLINHPDLKSNINNSTDGGAINQTFTFTLNPNRQPHVMPIEIYNLLSSQAHLISGKQHRQLISNTARTIVLTAASTILSLSGLLSPLSSGGTIIPESATDQDIFNYAEILWGDSEERAKRNAATISCNEDTQKRKLTAVGAGTGVSNMIMRTRPYWPLAIIA